DHQLRSVFAGGPGFRDRGVCDLLSGQASQRLDEEAGRSARSIDQTLPVLLFRDSPQGDEVRSLRLRGEGGLTHHPDEIRCSAGGSEGIETLDKSLNDLMAR